MFCSERVAVRVSLALAHIPLAPSDGWGSGPGIAPRNLYCGSLPPFYEAKTGDGEGKKICVYV